MTWLRHMRGWLDPKTQKATAFYALLGVLCSQIYHAGLDQWDLAALILLTGIGSLSGLAELIHSRQPPADPPGGKG